MLCSRTAVDANTKYFLLVMLIGTSAYATGASLCVGGVTSVPTFSLSSATGSVGDFTLSCSNGGPGGPGTLQLDFALGANVLNTGSWTLTESVFSSTYIGSLIGANDIRFTGVAYDSSQAAYSFEIHGVKVNPSLNPPGFNYLESLSVSNSIPVAGASQIVAVNATPEPSTLLLTAMALGGLLLLVHRRARPTGASDSGVG